MAFQKLALKNYNRNSHWQQIENMMLLDHFAKITKLGFQKKITNVADFGSSEGGNAIKFFGTFFSKYLSQRQDDFSVNLYHCDLLENNWNNFFKSLNSSPESYLKFPFVNSRVIGKSFYNQLFDNNSLDVAYSAFSFHYLSKSPERPPGEINYYHSGIQKQGLIDMKYLLNLRLKELCPGGYLYMVCAMRANEIPSFINITDKVFLNCFEKELLTKEECLSMSSNVYLLNEVEFTNVVDSISNQAEVVEYRFCKSICPYYIEYLNDKNYEKYLNKLYGFNNALIDRMLRERLRNFGKSHLIRKIQDEFKRLFRESKSVPSFDYVVLALKKK